jgi:hypothetical protein
LGARLRDAEERFRIGACLERGRKRARPRSGCWRRAGPIWAMAGSRRKKGRSKKKRKAREGAMAVGPAQRSSANLAMAAPFTCRRLLLLLLLPDAERGPKPRRERSQRERERREELF